MITRRGSVHDLERIVELWHEMMLQHVAVNEIYRMKENAREIYTPYARTLIMNPEKLVLVCEEAEEVCGFIFAEVSELPPFYLEEKIGVITELAVSSAVRRKGAGSKLLKGAEKWFAAIGIQRIECMIAADYTESKLFWNSNGYRSYNEICFKKI